MSYLHIYYFIMFKLTTPEKKRKDTRPQIIKSTTFLVMVVMF